jgi:GTP diphosphokinase / guanosine-3',5'-bis(diphosphate) 3'-diphosphatase
MATAIAEANANIDSVNVEEQDGSHYANVNFTVQVRDRVHLASLFRNLRKIQEVVRIVRLKGNYSEEKIQ